MAPDNSGQDINCHVCDTLCPGAIGKTDDCRKKDFIGVRAVKPSVAGNRRDGRGRFEKRGETCKRKFYSVSWL